MIPYSFSNFIESLDLMDSNLKITLFSFPLSLQVSPSLWLSLLDKPTLCKKCYLTIGMILVVRRARHSSVLSLPGLSQNGR